MSARTPTTYRNVALVPAGTLDQDRVVVEAWNGPRQPWRASAYLAGTFVGATGGCKTPRSAEQRGLRIWLRAAKAADVCARERGAIGGVA